MGIPLLHPWANRLAARVYEVPGTRVALPPPDGRYPTDPNGLPIHGALPKLLAWEVQDAREDQLTARLDWRGGVLEELFAFAHRLVVTATASDDGLRLETTL